MRKFIKSGRNIPVWILAVLIVATLPLSGVEHLFAAAESQGNKSAEQWEDPDYWVHIRNVSIYEPETHTLDQNMFVLVVGNHIHKTGKVPMMIFDKDLTYNFDGEGRILMAGFVAATDPSGAHKKAAKVEEGVAAHVVVVEARTLAELDQVMASPEWSDWQQRADLESVKLILDNGWVIKDTLANKRIDEFRLKRVKKKRQEMGLAIN